MEGHYKGPGHRIRALAAMMTIEKKTPICFRKKDKAIQQMIDASVEWESNENRRELRGLRTLESQQPEGFWSR